MSELEVITRRPTANAHPTPLLFVHGAWQAAWCWEEYFLPYFADHGYTSVALSLRGHGGSPGREKLRWTPIARYVEDVEQVAATLDKPPVIIGHSMGGFVTQKYLEKHKAPAAALLASVPHYGMIQYALRITAHRPLAALKGFGTFTPYYFVNTPELARYNLFSPDLPEDKFQSYFARIQNESMRAAYDMTALNLPRVGQVKAHGTPILVLGAENDFIFPPHEQRSLARAYDTEVTLFPNMAHQIMIENGWKEVAGKILSWLGGLGI
jgi:pimeloyl-ACP methyl ester carboxylesterase